MRTVRIPLPFALLLPRENMVGVDIGRRLLLLMLLLLLCCLPSEVEMQQRALIVYV